MAKPPISTAAAKSLGNSINSILGGVDDDDAGIVISIAQIIVEEQIRTEFENEDHSLADLAASIKKQGILQPLLVRPAPGGKFRLVAGERRLRAAKIAGLAEVPVLVKELDDEGADDAQAAENIHRKNLTQMEEAKRVKRDLDRLKGDTAAVLAKYNKPASWLSKTLAVLDLGPEAQKAVKEDLTADKEVLSDLRQIEKRDPKAAKAAVDALREDGGKGKAREIVKAVKDTVKPPKKKEESSKPASGGGTVATPKNREHEEPGPASVYGASGATAGPGFSPEDAIEQLSDSERKQLEKRLKPQFTDGKSSLNVAQDLIRGLRDGTFGSTGDSVLRLGAFMQGALRVEPSFDLVKCVESVKL